MRKYNREADPKRVAYKNAWKALNWAPHNRDKEVAARERYERRRGSLRLVLPREEIEPPLKVESDAIIVASDFHIPFASAEWIGRMIGEAKKRRIRDLAIVGDFWDCDALAIYPKYFGQPFTFEEEIGIVRDVLAYIAQHFDRVFICQGNHEYRWSRIHTQLCVCELWRQVFAVDSEALFKLFKKVNITANDYIELKSGGERWRLCHPKNYRQNPLSVATALAQKHQCNIANAHGHFAAGPELEKMSKRWWVMDLGGLFNPRAIEYMQRSSTFPQLNRGFAVITGGCPELVKERVGEG